MRDLFAQKWEIKFQEGIPHINHPSNSEGIKDKDWYRAVLLKERDKQLHKPAVTRFIDNMERKICDLIANPTSLIKAIDTLGAESVKPYLQIIDSKNDRDDITGLRLLDIWRYFRLTWALPHKPTPGRKLFILIRDAGQKNHPIMGIAALGNSIIQITSRDNEIGWTIESLIKRIDKLDDSSADIVLQSLRIALERAISGISMEDFIPAGKKLLTIQEQILLLERIVEEVPEPSSSNAHMEIGARAWSQLSQTSLYRRKRASSLIELLRANNMFQQVPTESSLVGLRKLLTSSAGRSAITIALQANKKEKIGANMMDIIVCGAIPPYNHLLAGKLVSLLMMSPEVNRYYEERYQNQVSVIASGMKGEPVIRDSRLVFLGTTSLYETGSSQYNRVSLPINSICSKYTIKKMQFQKLGLTKGFGTVYVSDQTVGALSDLILKECGSQQVSTTFGEGTSPRLRLIKKGLNLLGLPASNLIRHNFKRIVYGVELAENTYEFLRGEEETPRYYLNQENPEEITEEICKFWRNRWLAMRIKNSNVLNQVREFRIEEFLVSNNL